MKPKKFVDENLLNSMIQIKARRKGYTYDFYTRFQELYTCHGIPKFLPRKEKKRRVGTRDRRRKERKLHLSTVLVDSFRSKLGRKALESITKVFEPNQPFPLTILTNSIKDDKSNNAGSQQE